MNSRFLLAFAFFVFVVGGGALWLYYNILKRKQLLQNLLSLPKERRFFWYLLRKGGFKVISHQLIRTDTVWAGTEAKSISLKADFLVKRDRHRYVGLFSPDSEEKELLKLLYVYSEVFRTDGVIYYDEYNRSFIVWERS